MPAALAHCPKRGSMLLLAHCAPAEGSRTPVQERLQAKLGGELARRLMRALLPRQDRSDDLVA